MFVLVFEKKNIFLFIFGHPLNKLQSFSPLTSKAYQSAGSGYVNKAFKAYDSTGRHFILKTDLLFLILRMNEKHIEQEEFLCLKKSVYFVLFHLMKCFVSRSSPPFFFVIISFSCLFSSTLHSSLPLIFIFPAFFSILSFRFPFF